MKSLQGSDHSYGNIAAATGSFMFVCSTDLYKDLVVPEKWEESEPQFITNSEEVRLCAFATTTRKVNTMTAYKLPANY